MASFSSGLNPNVVKTALDDVFFQEFDLQGEPNIATAETPEVFVPATTDRAAIIEEVFKGVGYWDSRAEEQDVPGATPRVGNQITFSVTNYSKSVDIPKNYFDDEQHNTVNRMIREMAETARLTRDRNAFAVYRDAFDGNTFTTADGSALCSDTHTTLSGDTVDNKGTAALAPSAVDDGIVSLMEQKAQDGTIRGHMARVLLVAPANYRLALQIANSQQDQGTADNDMNVFRGMLPLKVMTSPFLGAAAGGSDTAWFLLARNHSVTRWVRQPLETALVDWKVQRNNNYVYKGEYREVVGAIDYSGVWGSAGTA